MQVRAIHDCFVDSTFRNAGEEFSYGGPKNKHLEPLDSEKTSGKKKDETQEDN